MADIRGAEQLLRHPVALTLVDEETAVMVAASIAGVPPRTRLAWIDWRAASIVARIECPPGIPSRMRPLVATEVRVSQAGIDDRVVAVRVDRGVGGVRLVLADEAGDETLQAGPGGVAVARIPANVPLVAIDALSAAGEPVGRLDGAGIGQLVLAGGRIAGRLGVGHGLAAGFGAGHWVDGIDDVTFEAGFAPRMPTWVPDGLEQGAFHVEPDVAYPAAAPSIVVAWGREPRRVLVRQMPGVAASPDPGGARTEAVSVGAAPAVLMARGRFATLVWQGEDRAFGVQVSGFDLPGQVAVRVAASL